MPPPFSISSVSRASRRVAWCLLPCLLVGVPAIPSVDESVSANQQVEFFLRALEFDHNLKARAAPGLNVMVLHYGDAREEVQEIVAAFRENGQKGVQGLSVDASAVAFESVAHLLQQSREEGFNAIFLHASAERALTSIQQVSRARKIPTLAATRSLVERGASLAVFRVDGSLKLVVNLRAAKLEGLRLHSSLLSISELIE